MTFKECDNITQSSLTIFEIITVNSPVLRSCAEAVLQISTLILKKKEKSLFVCQRVNTDIS